MEIKLKPMPMKGFEMKAGLILRASFTKQFYSPLTIEVSCIKGKFWLTLLARNSDIIGCPETVWHQTPLDSDLTMGGLAWVVEQDINMYWLNS